MDGGCVLAAGDGSWKGKTAVIFIAVGLINVMATSRIRHREELARRTVAECLGVPVFHHDDGSAPGMYDLRVGEADNAQLAIECVGAIDAGAVETWNVGAARGPRNVKSESDWALVTSRQVRIKSLDAQLQEIVDRCTEQLGPGHHRVDHTMRRTFPLLYQYLTQQSVLAVSRGGKPGTGLVYLAFPSEGGPVDRDGVSIPRWVESFLSDPRQGDVLQKLDRAVAHERHVFIHLGGFGPPWSVRSYFFMHDAQLPREAPKLPPPVSGVWIAYVERGLRWSSAGWERFSVRESPE